VCVGASGGVYALASFALCSQLVPALERRCVGGGGERRPGRGRQLRDGRLVGHDAPGVVDDDAPAGRLLGRALCLAAPCVHGVVVGPADGVGHGAHLSGAAAGAAAYGMWRLRHAPQSRQWLVAGCVMMALALWNQPRP
jgi:hypothetical protein